MKQLITTLIVVVVLGSALWIFALAEEKPIATPTTEKPKHKHTNNLANETSPYLLQHAHNPVNWHPWGKAAFELAAKRNVPIFLSVGYSTCYWCHVMERECFEDEQVARVLNEHFVCIKVDREELPEVDEQYMLATQMLTGGGGWPNSVWLTPEGQPWMAATYVPRQQFIPLLEQLAQLWNTQRARVDEQAENVTASLQNLLRPKLALTAKLERAQIAPVYAAVRSSYDEDNGGFGVSPKFPPHDQLMLLINEAQRTGDAELKQMIHDTLLAMWQGGVHDHIGGGFHRYSTDHRWFLPHFEKMLYDNAQLLRIFALAYELEPHEEYRTAAADIVTWLNREMTSPDGAFYSAIDSESEAGEGAYYLWEQTELNKLLGEKDAERFARAYGFETEGNYREEATGHRPGTNLPYLPISIDQFAALNSLPADELHQSLAKSRQKLLAHRAARDAPHIDDKILASWNGLMISGLAEAGRVFNEPSYLRAAEKSAEFLRSTMTVDDELQRVYRAGTAKLPGTLDDYAFVAEGYLGLHHATKDPQWLNAAEQLTRQMVDLFTDPAGGAFYFTSSANDYLPARSKNLFGGGNTPTGNAVAAIVLLELSRLAKQPELKTRAKRILLETLPVVENSPGSAINLAYAMARFLDD